MDYFVTDSCNIDGCSFGGGGGGGGGGGCGSGGSGACICVCIYVSNIIPWVGVYVALT